MRQLPFKPTAFALAFTALTVAGPGALADPAGPVVRSGAATVTGMGTGALTVTTSTPGALIQWQSFQVGAGQSVNFVLPNTLSTVLNQIIGNAAFAGPVTPLAQVMFMQNGHVSGAGLAALDLGNSVFAALKLNRAAAPPADDRREGLAREIVARLGDGQIVALAQTRDDVSTSASGEVFVAAGRSVELADINNPNLRVLVRAPAGRSLNVSQLLSRARSTGVFGVMLAQPRPTQRTDADPAHLIAGIRDNRDALDTLVAYLDGHAARIARLADPAPDLLPTVLAALQPSAPAPLQVASLAAAAAMLPANPPANPPAAIAAVPLPAQDIELMESRVSSWQLAVAPPAVRAAADIELMEAGVSASSWQLGAAAQPADIELMETRVASWQLAVAPVPAPPALDTELMEAGVTSWQLSVAVAVAAAAAAAPVAPAAVFAAANPAANPAAVPAPGPAEKPVQIASAAPGEAPRITLPERRTAPPKLIRIEFRGSSFFM